MTVDFVKLKRHYDLYALEYEEAALRALRSGWYILGNELVSFESQFENIPELPIALVSIPVLMPLFLPFVH